MKAAPKSSRGIRLVGMLAEFPNAHALIEAVRKTRSAGYRQVDAYTPYPIEEVWEELGHHHSKVPLLVLIGGILGGSGGFALCYWTSVIDYPLNIGGRPFNSWPAFIPPTFECTILVAGIFAVLGMLALNGLPMPYHPVFAIPRFSLVTRDRFFLAIDWRDPRFDKAATTEFLKSLDPTEVNELEE